MQNLSLDEVFCVMEFLPCRDLANSLIVCTEWYSLDQFEPFWKTILHHHIRSNIIVLFGKMVDIHGATIKNCDKEKVKKILTTGNAKETSALISSLRAVKGNKNSTQFLVDKALWNVFLTSYDVHILKDKTASRESLKKFIIHDDAVESGDKEIEEHHIEESESNRPAVIGKRFKYLMEKQLHSKRSVTVSTFFNNNQFNYYSGASEDFMYSMFAAFSGKEFKTSEISSENYQLGKDAFSLFFKFHDQLDNAEKYWIIILDACIIHSKDYMGLEEYEQVLKRILELKSILTIDISWIEYLYFKTDNFTNAPVPLITQIFEKNKIGGNLSSYHMYHYLYNSVDELQFAKRVVEYLNFLEKFRTREEIFQTYINGFIISSIAKLSDTYVDELLRLYPFSFESISLYDCERCQITDKILEITSARGFHFSLLDLEKLLIEFTFYSHSTHGTIRCLIDHYNVDVYELERKTSFFLKFLESISRYNSNIDHVKYAIEKVFSNSPIEWQKLANIHGITTQVTDRIAQIVDLCCRNISSEELVYLRNAFTPNIFDMNIFAKCLSITNPESVSTLYNLTMFSENEKLSDHIDRMLEEHDWSTFTDTHFSSYAPSEDLYLVAVYRFVHQ